MGTLYEMQVMGTQSSSLTNLLAVTLTGFTVSSQNNTQLLTWNTMVEYNAGFSIERSQDGSSFSAIGWVAGQNKGSLTLHYSFTDQQVQTGKTYYRLRQVDTDGKAVYTAAIVVNNNGVATIKAFPNPVKDHLVIEYKGNANEKTTVAIFNASGQSVYSSVITTTAAQQSMVVNRTTAMKAGIYFLKVSSDNNHYTQQLIIQ